MERDSQQLVELNDVECPFLLQQYCYAMLCHAMPPYKLRKWMSWYDKNKSRQWRKIDLADSPKKSDVDAVYDGHQERRKKRLAQMRAEVKHSGGRSRDHTGTQDEAALPEWAYREGN